MPARRAFAALRHPACVISLERDWRAPSTRKMADGSAQYRSANSSFLRCKNIRLRFTPASVSLPPPFRSRLRSAPASVPLPPPFYFGGQVGGQVGGQAGGQARQKVPPERRRTSRSSIPLPGGIRKTEQKTRKHGGRALCKHSMHLSSILDTSL